MPPRSGATAGSSDVRRELSPGRIELSSSLEQFVFHECVSPDHILVLLEISIKNLAYLVAVDVISVDQFDERVGFVKGHSRNLALCRATTVPVKRDPH